MAQNSGSIRFVGELIAAFGRYPVSKDTEELYKERLSRWKLIKPEWDNALDRLLESRQDESLPTLAEIYEALKKAKAATDKKQALGWLSFDLNGNSYSVRIINQGGVWVNAPCSMTDAQGNKVILQNNPWKVPKLPEGAINIVCSPDNEANPKDEDMPSKEQVKFYLAKINQTINSIVEKSK